MVDTAIVGLALKDENNLEAALRIGENFIAIRSGVVTAFLECILVHLEEWVQKHGEDWEVRLKWRVGNWIERPMDKYLPLLLRKSSWPALVGVGIQAEWTGPSEVFIGVSGPTQATWNTDGSAAKNAQFYGEFNRFIGPESRQRIVKAVEPPGQQSNWWVYYTKNLSDSAGQDISDWRDSKLVRRLFSDRDALSMLIVIKMTSLATTIGSLVIDTT